MERNDPAESHPAEASATLRRPAYSTRYLHAKARRSLRIDRPVASERVWPLIPMAVLVGVLAGFLELGVFHLQREVWPRLSREALLWNRNADWMIPITGAGLCLTLTLLGGLWARRHRPSSQAMVLSTALVLGPILAIRGIHPLAGLILALGLGFRLAPAIQWAGARLGRGTIPLAAVGLVALGAWAAGTFESLNVRSPDRQVPVSPQVVPTRLHPPNLLWIVLDTVRADRMSLHGYERPTTPQLERWAARGITFDDARSAAPWTLPSHMTMFTGLWPFEHGARIDRPYRGTRPLVTEVLSDRDYDTAGFVANFECVNACFGFDRGFDTFIDDSVRQEISPRTVLASSSLGRLLLPLARKLGPAWKWPPTPHVKPASEVFQLTRNWLDQRRAAAPDRSYFAFLNLMDAHGPYRPPAPWPRRFWTAEIPKRIRETTPELGFEALRAARSATPAERPERLAAIESAGMQLGDLYDDCLASLDDQLGAFLDELEAKGELADTWIIITSDHGEHFGEHGHFGHGSSLYDAALHVPLILIPPLDRPYDDARGRRVAPVVSLRDLPATVSDLLLSAGSGPFPGHSLARWWRSDDTTIDEAEAPIAQLAQQNIDAGHAVDGDAVRDIDALFARGRTLIRNRPATGAVDELYDTTGDRRQLRNLADDPAEAERKRQLGELLDRRVRPRE